LPSSRLDFHPAHARIVLACSAVVLPGHASAQNISKKREKRGTQLPRSFHHGLSDSGGFPLKTSKAKWQLYPSVPESHLAEFPHLPHLLVQCLYNRGVISPDDVRRFLAGECDEGNPFQMAGIAEAVTRIRRAIRGDELVAVYGDFDADGVTAAVVLTKTLASLGGRVVPYIPHRVDEGYGLNENAIRKLAQRGVSLLVTVDCGARASAEIECAQSLNVDVIVTDHHSLGGELPAAVAVVNTKRADCPYPFKALSGVGIAFKVAQALLLAHQQMPLDERQPPLQVESLLDLVALGTVADLSPLWGENRSLVKRGLAQLNQPHRPGIVALMEEAGVEPGAVTGATIGYVLGPRLNAAGRVDDAMLSYQLLSASSAAPARELAELLEQKNQQRREMMLAAVEDARVQVVDQEDEFLLFATGDDYHEGVIGLAAQRLCDEHYRPVVVVKAGEKESVASARSVDEFNITAALDDCASLLIRHGGHSRAAGFTVSNENLVALREKLRQMAAERLAGIELLPTLHVDAEIPLTSLQLEDFYISKQLEPLGRGNPEPLLLSTGVEVRDSRVVGEDHLKLTLTDGRVVWDGIAFGMGDRTQDVAPRMDVVYSPQVREWRDEEQLQLRIEDFRPAS
jgi:single-stranded-DNA-specific exonuclease